MAVSPQAESDLGALARTHGPASSLRRGPAASFGAAAIAAATSALTSWLALEDAGATLWVGAAMAALLTIALLRTGIEGLRARVDRYERGVCISSSGRRARFRWTEIDSWTLHCVPGIRGRHERDPANVIGLDVHVRGASYEIPDLLDGFDELRAALEREVGPPARVVRHAHRFF